MNHHLVNRERLSSQTREWIGCLLNPAHGTLRDSGVRPQLRELYRMYLQNAEVPYKFATLLQLREMLAIGAEEGEALEQELLQSGASFSI